MEQELKDLIKRAENGEAGAQFLLGNKYYFGKGLEQNYQSAFKWYELSATQGHTQAKCNLGVMYELGTGIEKDLEKAVSLYQQSAKQGNAKAQCNLGVMYWFGKGVVEDVEKAFSLYQQSAKQGNAQGQFNLGVMYERGIGIDEDIGKAVSLYKQSAKQGNASAKCNLGLMYELGKGVNVNVEKAVSLYQQSAEQGNAQAQCNLGVMYEFGKGVKKDLEMAILRYRQSAEQGNARAQCNMAWCYESGQGAERDLTEAKYWYEKSANVGYIRAKYNLAFLLKYDFPTTESEAKAVELLKQCCKDESYRYDALETLDEWDRQKLSPEITELREAILQELKAEKHKEMTHYTSLDAGQKILLEQSPFRLGHINAVNDPNEGKLLWKELEQNPVEGRPVFIGCFLPDSDSLNMWRFYSKNHVNDDACGCAITFDLSRFFDYQLLEHKKLEQERNSENSEMAEQSNQGFDGFSNTGKSPQESAELYRVIYVKKGFKIAGSGAKSLSEHFNKLIQASKEFLGNKPSENKVKKLAWLLGPLPYLLKEESYKDEKEHRLIITHVKYGSDEIQYTEPDLSQDVAPSLFLKLHREDHLDCIKYVTLGPKAPNKEMIGPYWHHMLMNKYPEQLKDKKDFDIKQSKCAYK